MKSLLYKEFKLAMHPLCYIFVILFPLMILIPNYPIAIGFIYVLTAYPILFLGANKGQQSNDLIFSTLLPVRKKDIVLARMITVMIMHFVFIIISTALLPLALYISNSIETAPGAQAPADVGIGLDGYVSVLAICLVGYAIADLIFFPIYYKHGKSIVMSTLLTILGFVAYILVFTILLPYLKGFEWYLKILCKSGLGIQFALLGGGLIIYASLHLVVYKISSRRLEKVDF